MSKKVIWIVVAVVVVLAAGAYLLFHNSSDKSSNTASSNTSNASQQASNPSTNTNPADVIQTKTASNVGDYLATSDGQALYTYGADTNGVSNCDGSCLAAWPAYAPGPTNSLPANVTVITRTDGSKQYAYKGLPLYTFTSDSNGQVTGDGVSNFSVAKP